MNASTTSIMKSAWSIARKGAAKFGGKVRAYFAAALKQAWEVAKAPRKTMLNIINNSRVVKSVTEWSKGGCLRHYIRFDGIPFRYVKGSGYQPEYYGDRTVKAYVEADKLVIIFGKGFRSDAMDDAISQLIEEVTSAGAKVKQDRDNYVASF